MHIDGFECHEDGPVTLVLGDCLAVMPKLASQSVDMVCTDPPYGHSNHDGDLNAVLNAHREIVDRPILNDDMDAMRRVVDAMLSESVRLMKKEGSCCCCCCGGGGPKPTFAWLANRMDSKGLAFFHSVIWDKVNPGLGWRYRRQHEMVMIAHRSDGALAWNEDMPAQRNVISLAKPKDDDLHPNLKPVSLMLKLVQNHTVQGGLVLDPFMGSGTTGVACVQLERRFLGIEQDRAHYETAKARIKEALEQHLPLVPRSKAEFTEFSFQP